MKGEICAGPWCYGTWLSFVEAITPSRDLKKHDTAVCIPHWSVWAESPLLKIAGWIENLINISMNWLILIRREKKGWWDPQTHHVKQIRTMPTNMAFLLCEETDILSWTPNEGIWVTPYLGLRFPSLIVVFPYLTSLFLPFTFNHNAKLLSIWWKTPFLMRHRASVVELGGNLEALNPLFWLLR